MPFAVAPPPQAQPAPAAAGPEWIRKPTTAEVRAAYPAEAAAQGIGGQAYLRCRVSADTRLRDCEALGEAPQGAGFGKAALPLTAAWRIKPNPPGQSLLIPIRFDPPAPAEGALPVDLHVAWTTAPTKAEVEAIYPKAARAKGVGGLGVMACAVSSGQLTDCHPAGDDPAGFSRAAVRLAGRFGIAPTFAEDRKTEGLALNVPVAFGRPAKAGASGAPPWTAQPTADQIASTFPVAARQEGYDSVSVTARCRAAADGALEGCQVTHEDPVGLGGAQAALRLADTYRVSAWTPQGLPVAGEPVSFTVVMKPREEAPTPPAATKAAPTTPQRAARSRR